MSIAPGGGTAAPTTEHARDHIARLLILSALIGAASGALALATLRSYEFLDVPATFPAYRTRYEGAPALVERPAPPLARKVVLVIVDGLDEPTSRREDLMPALASLRERGSARQATVAVPSFTRPGLASILTGAPPWMTGVLSNRHRGPVAVPSLFTVARARYVATGVQTDGNEWFGEMFGRDIVREAIAMLRCR